MPHLSPRIIYSSHYDIGLAGLEHLHPFDSHKYGKAYRVLKQEFGRTLTAATVRPARALRREELLAFHTPEYLDKLKNPVYVANALEVQALRSCPAG